MTQPRLREHGGNTARRPTAVATAPQIRCLIVDDHPAVRAGLQALLASAPDLRVLEACASAEEAWTLLQRGRARVDVAIVDYQLPGHSGLWLCHRLRSRPEPPAVLVYSAFSDGLLSAACLVAGAGGLVPKTALGGELADRVRQAARGERIPLEVSPGLCDAIGRSLEAGEQAIFGMMCAGVPAPEIAQTLAMRDSELEVMVAIMLRKLGRVDGPR